MTNGKNLAFLAVISFLLISATDSVAQELSLSEEEISQINQKIASLVDEFANPQYAKREKAAEKFVAWFIDTATTPPARTIIKQGLSGIQKDEGRELEVRHRSAAVLKVFQRIERGEEFGIEINSRKLSGGETIIVESLGSYCRFIDNCERLLKEPGSADLDNLAKNGQRTLPFLLKILEKNLTLGLSSSCAAIKMLGKIGDKPSIEALMKILKDDDRCFLFQHEAVKALTEIILRQKEGNEYVIDELIAILKGPESNRRVAFIRWYIMELIKKVGGEKAVETLAFLMRQDDEPEVNIRISAAIYLGEIGDSRAINALEQAALSDPCEYVRFWAQNALKKIREKEKARKELTF